MIYISYADELLKEVQEGKWCEVWEHHIKDGESLKELEMAISYEHIIDIYDKSIARFWSLEKALDYISYLNTTAKENIFYYVTT